MEMETKNTPAIEFRNVSLSFDEKRVLVDVNLKLERGFADAQLTQGRWELKD